MIKVCLVIMYNYLIMGSGLYGSEFAYETKRLGKIVLVVEKRPHITENIYTENAESRNVHEYVNWFVEFNCFTNSLVGNYKGELYSLPFNMYTFNKMWGVVTPEGAAAKIEEKKRDAGIMEPKNLEEQASSLIGTDIYEKLIKGYTMKQWSRYCDQLPTFNIKRLPVRLAFDNIYLNAFYQGILIGGYTKIEVRLGVDYLVNKEEWDSLAEEAVYAGPIDAYFGYSLGSLQYRSVRFKIDLLDISNFQGNTAVNYKDSETPWRRIIEYKWLEFGKDADGNDLSKTVIFRGYSSEWKLGDEPYYPVNDANNRVHYSQYWNLADAESNMIFGRRLGEYKYYNMNQMIAVAFDMRDKEIKL